jgi:hypothetical protein
VSVVANTPHEDYLLSADVIAHLDAQLVAARGLLSLVLEQGAAIRRRDVQTVVRVAGMLQVEMQRRQLLEGDRLRLLRRAGGLLSTAPETVTLSMLESLMDPDYALEARERTSELRGLLAEIQREHTVNRALMTQELAFLDHLLRLTGSAGGGYDAGGDHASTSGQTAITRRRVFDMEA